MTLSLGQKGFSETCKKDWRAFFAVGLLVQEGILHVARLEILLNKRQALISARGNSHIAGGVPHHTITEFPGKKKNKNKNTNQRFMKNFLISHYFRNSDRCCRLLAQTHRDQSVKVRSFSLSVSFTAARDAKKKKTSIMPE